MGAASERVVGRGGNDVPPRLITPLLFLAKCDHHCATGRTVLGLVVSIAWPLLGGRCRRVFDREHLFRRLRKTLSECSSAGAFHFVSTNQLNRVAVLGVERVAKRFKNTSVCYGDRHRRRASCYLQLGAFRVASEFWLSRRQFERAVFYRIARDVS